MCERMCESALRVITFRALCLDSFCFAYIHFNLFWKGILLVFFCLFVFLLPSSCLIWLILVCPILDARRSCLICFGVIPDGNCAFFVVILKSIHLCCFPEE